MSLKSFLSNIFSGVAAEENLPYYFWGKEHFEAAERIIKLRELSIKKQDSYFDDLRGDIEILEARMFGDLSEASESVLQQEKNKVIADIKKAPLEDKEAYLRGIYNCFNGGRYSANLSLDNWLETYELDVHEDIGHALKAKRPLSQHHKNMHNKNTAKGSDPFRGQCIESIDNANKALSKLIISMRKAETKLSVGFGLFNDVQNDPRGILNLLQDEEQFNLKFDEYVDSLMKKLDKVCSSSSNPEDWDVAIDNTKAMVEALAQQQENGPQQGAQPEVLLGNDYSS